MNDFLFINLFVKSFNPILLFMFYVMNASWRACTRPQKVKYARSRNEVLSCRDTFILHVYWIWRFLWYLVDCHELFHKIDKEEWFDVEFMIYEFKEDTKMWLWSHVECWLVNALLMTWEIFYSFLREKYMTWTLRDRRRDEIWT